MTNRSSHLMLVPESSINIKQILNEIKTPFYEAVCMPYDINVKFKSKKRMTYHESKPGTITNRIFEYSSTELLYYYKKCIHYTDGKINKDIITNLELGGYSLHYNSKYNKLICIRDGGDPPDVVHIIPINEILNSPIDMYDDDTHTYFVTSFSAWSSTIEVHDDYIYEVDEDGLVIIDINTNEMYSHGFKLHPPNNSDDSDVEYDFTIVKRKNILTVSLIDSDKNIIQSHKIKFNPTAKSPLVMKKRVNK
jgi:hypothetical protein